MKIVEINRFNHFIIIGFLMLFVAGCGPTVSRNISKDRSYKFNKNDKTVLLSIINHDNWILEGNNIFENELYSLAASLLGENGFTITNTNKESKYLFVLNIGSEVGQKSIYSYTTTETQVDVYGGGGLKETPKTHVAGGGTYRAVIVSGACFESETKRQVFFERTSTTMLNFDRLFGYTAEDMYRKPVVKIIRNFLEFTKEQAN